MNYIITSTMFNYNVEHLKVKFISTSGHVIFSLLYKHTNDNVFDDFLKISDHFPKISKDFPKLFRRKDERFRTFFGLFQKITEDFQRFSKISKEGPMLAWASLPCIYVVNIFVNGKHKARTRID